jgi:hypothetical protein
VGPLLQDPHQRTHDRQPRWERRARAALLAHDRALRLRGLSECQAAKARKVFRTTLQAWRRWRDTLDRCPEVAAFFPSGPGLASFVPRLVVGCHLALRRSRSVRHACGLSLAHTDRSGPVCRSLLWRAPGSEPPGGTRACGLPPRRNRTVGNGHAPHRPPPPPGRNLSRRALPGGEGACEQRHAWGTTDSERRSNQVECAHGPGPGTTQLSRDAIDQ